MNFLGFLQVIIKAMLKSSHVHTGKRFTRAAAVPQSKTWAVAWHGTAAACSPGCSSSLHEGCHRGDGPGQTLSVLPAVP